MADLSMDFQSLIRHLQGDFAHLKEIEVLMVIRNSPMRRFRIMAGPASHGTLRWTPVRIRAIQGHRAFLVENGGMANLVKKMYTFDEHFDVSRIDDPDHHPHFIATPGGSPVWEDFPRLIYHTCDQAAFLSIVENGLIPGGFPHKTGRAHSFFNSTPPWNAQMRKLQGTRAGRPIALAFDTEMLMQLGVKLFAADEAIITPDWVTNCALVSAYDMRAGEFFWVNRAYATNRKLYQDALRIAKEEDPTEALLSKMEMVRSALMEIFDRIPSRIEVGQLLPFGPKESMVVERSTATREGEPTDESNTVDGYYTVRVAALTSAEACGYQRRGRWGKGGGGHWGKGHGKEGFELRTKDVSTNEIQIFPKMRCPNGVCRYFMIDGHIKCPQCHMQLEPVTDAHVATEVARREAMARTRGVPFSMDKVVFNSPRRARVGTRAGSSSSDPTRTRSSYGLLKDMAKNHLRSFRKKGFSSLVDRLQRDAFYHFNAANQNLIPEALDFIERLAGCVSPTIERSKAQVYGERLDFATKLVFVHDPNREKDEPLDLHKEVFICHRGVFLDIGQFAVYVAKFIVPKKRPLPLVHGWLNQEFVPDGEDAKTIGKELVEFAKIQWIEYASGQAHHEPDASGADREVSLPYASTSARLDFLNEPLPQHEQFEPNMGKKGRPQPYERTGRWQDRSGGRQDRSGGWQDRSKGQQQQQKGQQQKGKKGDAGKGQGKGKQGKSPPGGVTYIVVLMHPVSFQDRGHWYTWNSMVMMLELEMEGRAVGLQLGLGDGSTWVLEEVEPTFQGLDTAFVYIFLVELLFRILAEGRNFFCDVANWFDTVLVLVGLVDVWIIVPVTTGGTTDPQNIVMMRLFRAVKCLRAIRMVRTFRLFRGLNLLVKACQCFLPSLGWSMVLLFVFMSMGTLIMGNLLRSFVEDPSNLFEDRVWIWNRYGTAYRAMYTLYEVTFAGNWPTNARPVLEKVSHAFVLLSCRFPPQPCAIELFSSFCDLPMKVA
eukprot:s1214_g18.t1